MRQPNVSVYGSKTCPDTTRAMRYLDAQGIPYEFKDVDESPELNEYIAGLNGGKRVMPTIQVENDFLFNPDVQKLGEAVEAASASLTEGRPMDSETLRCPPGADQGEVSRGRGLGRVHPEGRGDARARG